MSGCCCTTEGDITSFVLFIKMEAGTAEGYRFAASPYSYVLSKWKETYPLLNFSKHGGGAACGICTFILFIKMEADMVRVERRSGKERRSGRDRRKRSTKGFGGAGRPEEMGGTSSPLILPGIVC